MLELSMRGTPVVPQGLTPRPVMDSLLGKMNDGSLDDFLNASQKISFALDVQEVAKGLVTLDFGDIAKGLIGMSDEVQNLFDKRIAAAPEAQVEDLDSDSSLAM